MSFSSEAMVPVIALKYSQIIDWRSRFHLGYNRKSWNLMNSMGPRGPNGMHPGVWRLAPSDHSVPTRGPHHNLWTCPERHQQDLGTSSCPRSPPCPFVLSSEYLCVLFGCPSDGSAFTAFPARMWKNMQLLGELSQEEEILTKLVR